MKKFQSVTNLLSQALEKHGYTTLTEVQHAVLEPTLKDADLLVSAQTGSGKTVAFGLAIAPTLMNGEESFSKTATPLALVIAPTRELALQVTRELEWLYASSGGMVVSCVGGMDMRAERNALKSGLHIVVGTPGRLKDHIERGSFDTSQLKAVVLDEADEMLDMGFREELQYILDTTPKERRTLLFSATVPKAILSMAQRYQRDAKRISTKQEQNQHVDISYEAFAIAPSDRENTIINLLRYHEAKSAIIFCSTRAEVNHLTSRLTNRGFSVVSLSGELSQSDRSKALQSLRDGRAQVCVATDVASRGLDLPGLALVIHADMPKDKDILLHRSGRTGRAGSKGVSALVVPHNWRSRAERLLLGAKINAQWKPAPSIKDILDRDRERFLTNPALTAPVTDDERASIGELLARYSPEQIAAALMRLHQEKKPAPEELLDAAPAPSESTQHTRDHFGKSVWVSLSIGRETQAEPRWILPMLCGAGHLTKGQIGAIKINPRETHVELKADCVDGFFAAIGASRKIEKNIVVTRLHGAPPASSQGRDERPKRPFKKDFSDRGPRNPKFGGGGESKPYAGGKPKSNEDGVAAKPYTGGKPKPYAGGKLKLNEGSTAKPGFKKKPKVSFKNKPK